MNHPHTWPTQAVGLGFALPPLRGCGSAGRRGGFTPPFGEMNSPLQRQRSVVPGVFVQPNEQLAFPEPEAA